MQKKWTNGKEKFPAAVGIGMKQKGLCTYEGFSTNINIIQLRDELWRNFFSFPSPSFSGKLLRKKPLKFSYFIASLRHAWRFTYENEKEK